ncbi:MAG: hypothetical protein AB1607_04435 [Chloroflexota bacterium]
MRRSTIGYLLLLLVAVGAYYFINNREEPADITVTFEPEDVVTYLFNAEDGIPTGIRIESKNGEVVEVAKNADGAWELIQPLEASADSAAAEAAASQITTLRIEDTIPDLDLDIVGLNDPEYTLIVTFGDVERIAQIGVITPTESEYYILSPAGDVVIVDKFSVDGLLGLLTNPPYLETPTPSPTATETPLPTPTPEAGTPTPATSTPQP